MTLLNYVWTRGHIDRMTSNLNCKFDLLLIMHVLYMLKFDNKQVSKLVQPWWLSPLGRQLSHSVDRCTLMDGG